MNKIEKDLSTFSNKDLQTMFSFYHVSSIPSLASKIYRQGYLPNIFNAIKSGDLKEVKKIVETPGFDINIREKDMTPLMRAITSKENKIAMYLVDNGADVNLTDDDGLTPLIFSTSKDAGGMEIAKYLIDHGADINIRDGQGYTALLYAVEDQNNEFAKLLVEHGANVNLQNDEGETPLMQTIDYIDIDHEHIDHVKALELAKYLIDHGSDLTLKNEDGESALSLLDEQQNEELLSYIIEKDIKILKNVYNHLPFYTKLKTLELKTQIKTLKKLIDKKEASFLEENKNCLSKDIDDLEKCKKTAEEMIKYKPTGKKAKKLEKKYDEHPYFKKK